MVIGSLKLPKGLRKNSSFNVNYQSEKYVKTFLHPILLKIEKGTTKTKALFFVGFARNDYKKVLNLMTPHDLYCTDHHIQAPTVTAA